MKRSDATRGAVPGRQPPIPAALRACCPTIFSLYDLDGPRAKRPRQILRSGDQVQTRWSDRPYNVHNDLQREADANEMPAALIPISSVSTRLILTRGIVRQRAK